MVVRVISIIERSLDLETSPHPVLTTPIQQTATTPITTTGTLHRNKPEDPRVAPQVNPEAQNVGNAPASFSPEMLATLQQMINQAVQAAVHHVPPPTPNPPIPAVETPQPASGRDPSKIALALEKMRPPVYEGLGDPVEVEHWINQMEKYFDRI